VITYGAVARTVGVGPDSLESALTVADGFGFITETGV
jgi:hypothetical protein